MHFSPSLSNHRVGNRNRKYLLLEQLLQYDVVILNYHHICILARVRVRQYAYCSTNRVREKKTCNLFFHYYLCLVCIRARSIQGLQLYAYYQLVLLLRSQQYYAYQLATLQQQYCMHIMKILLLLQYDASCVQSTSSYAYQSTLVCICIILCIKVSSMHTLELVCIYP